MRVLLVEDHAPLAANVGEYLTEQGAQVDYAYDGLSGLQLAAQGHYDVIVLDLNLPKLDGLSMCKRLRIDKGVGTPILMLTARDTVPDKVIGFDAGADDYLTKPFELIELKMRLYALLRRARPRQQSLQVGDLVFDTGSLRVVRADVALKLSPTGLRILELLMQRSPGVVTREELVSVLWGDQPPDGETTLRVHIHSLRNAIDKPFPTALLVTLPAIGYRLAVSAEN